MGSLSASNDSAKRVPALLTPFELGPFRLSHRVVMAPMSRMRWTSYHEQQPHVEKYYSQRASPGGLLITEATAISDTSQGQPFSPAIYEPAHIEPWKPIVKAVHAKGAFFFCQLWHVGRVSHTVYQPNGAPPVSSTDRKIDGPGTCVMPDGGSAEFSKPQALKTEEIPEIVQHFRAAAKNAILAGFDGVEIHGANGYLLEQFMKDGVNDRTDKYGGSLENRCRFPLEIVDAVAAEIGPDRVGVRLSPYTPFNASTESDPEAVGVYMAKELSKRKVAYMHCVEPRYMGRATIETTNSLVPFRKNFNGAFMVCGSYEHEDALAVVERGDSDLVAQARWFISNPDLPKRHLLNAPLTAFRREYFYSQEPVNGYTDYPFLDEQDEGKVK